MRKINIIISLSFLILINGALSAHPWKPEHYVIIDTDCGLDDFRAINLMLASSDIRVLAVIASNGVVNATDGYIKIKSLLQEFNQEGIIVGLNDNPNQKSMDCQGAIKFHWGKEQLKDIEYVDFKSALNQVFDNFSGKISFVNLGGLNTINTYLEKFPDKKDKISEVLWISNYNNLYDSFNFKLDSTSYKSLNGKHPIKFVNGNSFNSYSESLKSSIKEISSIPARNIYRSISIPGLKFAKNMYDESAVFYLLNKDVLSLRDNNREYFLESGVSLDMEFIGCLLSEKEVKNQVLGEFLMDTLNYHLDIQSVMISTIENYGEDEWVACVLTSELHRHLGVYSIIGAKMGIRAREYFGAGIDEIAITSYAGLKPPFSCLNDGLQVSTGATIGHGLISVIEDSILPKAEFKYLGQKITISLKEEFRNKIAEEIKELSIIYGLDSETYWDLVRDLAINYWGSLNRHEIFIIE